MSIYGDWSRLRDRALSRVDGYSRARTTTDIQMIRRRWSLGPFLCFDLCKKVLISPTTENPDRLCFKVYHECTVTVFFIKVSIALPVRPTCTLI